jgi:DNA replication protein DnaC
VELLILDEWLLHRLKEAEARDLLEIVEARHQKGSTIFLSFTSSITESSTFQ